MTFVITTVTTLHQSLSGFVGLEGACLNGASVKAIYDDSLALISSTTYNANALKHISSSLNNHSNHLQSPPNLSQPPKLTTRSAASTRPSSVPLCSTTAVAQLFAACAVAPPQEIAEPGASWRTPLPQPSATAFGMIRRILFWGGRWGRWDDAVPRDWQMVVIQQFVFPEQPCPSKASKSPEPGVVKAK